jgi:hypothetical protein
VVGENNTASSQTLVIALNNLNNLPGTLNYYQTNSTDNMTQGANVAVSGGMATVSVPANTSFTLTGTSSQTPDTSAPTVSISAPANGSTVSASTAITANAADDTGVVGVQFKLDGANLGSEDISAPYSIPWDTAATTNGTHTLTAVARDAVGNSTISGIVSVTVNNVAQPGGSLLLGSQTIQNSADNNAAGSAEAFKYTATASGSAGSLKFYVNTGSAATGIKVGIYSDNGGHPGTLLTSGSITAPAAAAWNTATLSPNVSLVSGANYWIGFVGTGGTLNYRDLGSGGCSESLATASITNLPATWTSGQAWPSCTLSAYVTSTASAPDTQAPTTSVTSPTDGSSLTGTQSITANAADNVGVTKVEWYLDGTSN